MEQLKGALLTPDAGSADMDDLRLLRRYARTRDAEAFANLTRRYGALVYGVCVRALGNEHDAADAAQECFMDLARSAGSITSSLPGWLHAAATHRCLDAIRAASRRRYHEAVAMAHKNNKGGPTWAQVGPRMDQLLEELPEELRVPLILHFLQGQSQEQVAAELGINQSTVSRRLEKGLALLRRGLRGAGVIASAAVLAGLLTENAVQAAPAALTAALGKIAIAGIGEAVGATTVAGGAGAAGTTTAASATAAAVASAPAAAGVGFLHAKLIIAATVGALAVGGAVVALKVAVPSKPQAPQPVTPAKVVVERAGSKLAFCIVTNRIAVGKYGPQISEDGLTRWGEALATGGPEAAGDAGRRDYRWREAGCEMPPEAVVQTHQGKYYVLLHNQRPLALVPDGHPWEQWGVVRVSAVQDARGRWGIAFELDENGAREFESMTRQFVGLALAIVVDNKVVSAPRIKAEIPGKGIIMGSFTEQEARRLAEDLRIGMPAAFAFHNAARGGKLERVRELLDANDRLLEVEDPDRRGNRPLHSAVRHEAVVKFLLDRGADVNAKGDEGRTPLHMAAADATREIVELLLARGADVNAVDETGLTPLYMAAGGGTPEVLTVLLDTGANINGTGKVGLTPLSIAALQIGLSRRPEDVHRATQCKDILLARGAKLDIFSASTLGLEERVAEFLKADPGGAARQTAFVDFTPLHAAAMAGHARVAEMLIDAGADVNAVAAEESGSPLYLAGGMGREEVVRLLLDLGADVTRGPEGRQPIHAAAQRGHKSCVEMLLAAGADVNSADRGGRTPLHRAAAGWHTPVVELLLARGAEVNARMKNDRTALCEAMIAAQARSRRESIADLLAVVKVLISKGSDVNARDDEGRAALHWAAVTGQVEVAKALLEAGADPLMESRPDRPFDLSHRPIDIARQHPDRPEMLELLRAHAALLMAADRKAIEEAARRLLEAVRDGDYKTIDALAASHRDRSARVWDAWVEQVRADYAGQFDRLLTIVGSDFRGGLAEVHVRRPEGDKDKLLVLVLMQYPDGGWRAVKARNSPREPDTGLRWARSAWHYLQEFRNAIFDAAGQTESCTVSGSLSTGFPRDAFALFARVRNGNLVLQISTGSPVQTPEMEVQADRAKWWSQPLELRIARRIKLTRGDLLLEAQDGKATLSRPGQSIVFDVHEGKVRIRRGDEVTTGKGFAIDLLTFEVGPAP